MLSPPFPYEHQTLNADPVLILWPSPEQRKQDRTQSKVRLKGPCVTLCVAVFELLHSCAQIEGRGAAGGMGGASPIEKPTSTKSRQEF